MRNYFKILLLIMVLAISGCGSGATSADPLGTDTISVAAVPTSLGAGESSIITATVLHADGTAAPLRSVAFIISPNNSGGTITVNDDGKNNGIATATYTAGDTLATSNIQDTVIARIENGASAPVLITRTGSSASALSITTSATPATLTVDNSNSVVTANVKNNAGTVISGVTVTFSVTGGGTVPAPGTATTDVSGNAVIIFTGGPGVRPTGETDVVTASITVSGNTYTSAVIITYP